MRIVLQCIGKTDDVDLERLIAMYAKRVGHYINFELNIIPDLKKTKNLSEEQQKSKEGALILDRLGAGDVMILLDERGREYTSLAFAEFLQEKMNSGIKTLVFVIGGPYGFSDAVYAAADLSGGKAKGTLSLSKMTFSHQMIRLFMTEQLYRGFTILRNEPYHHR